jgi:nucleotide-binding universal stress UspA family protein
MLKNLMVHLDQGPRSTVRLEIAVSLAKNNQARLVGVFGQRANYKGSGLISTWPSNEHLLAGQASKRDFELATQGLQAEWLDINSGDDSEVLALISEKARYFDLVIMGQFDDSDATFVPADLVDEVLSNSGRPVLVIPYVGNFSSVFRRPLIAWNASRQAAHALNDALPLINNCEEAIVLAFDSSVARAEKSCKEVSIQLSCHGISSKAEVMVIENIGVMDMLLNNACDQGADLLVMGANSHFGFPFISRGAGTRHILRTMVLPVLMSS